MQSLPINDREFEQFRALIYRMAGISMAPSKKPLVSGRLMKRLNHHGMGSFEEYFRFVSAGNAGELQIVVDLLTTNETHFFREPKHFEFLRTQILPRRRKAQPFRLWSAASSTGEEAYSIAMLLADTMGGAPWEVVASDISSRVLEKARSGHYSMERAHEIPPPYLTRFCLKGVRNQEGTFLVGRNLRDQVRFMQVNLNGPLPPLGEFDVIFLRNVMIYFDQDTKRQVIQRMLPLLRSGGYLLVGHAESLYGVTEALLSVVPSVYRKP